MPGLTDEEIAKLEQDEGGGGLTDEQMVELEKASASGPSRHMSSRGESLMGGIANSTTAGFGDEIMGGIKAVGDVMGDKYSMKDFGDRYKRRRDEYRAYNEAAREDNPATYMAGEIGGSAATAFIPGMGGANMGKMILTGGAMGLGNSNADLTEGNFDGAIEDTTKGMMTGLATHGIAKAIPAVAKGAGELYKKVPENVLPTAGKFVGALKGGIPGYVAGGVGGKALDKTLRKGAEVLTSDNVVRAMTSGRLPESVVKILERVAEKDPTRLALTFQLLSKKNPELMSSLEQ